MDRYPDTDRRALEHRRNVMDDKFPSALVEEFESLIDTFDLPDPDDRHVVAAAVHAQADVIVTDNIDDFPPARLPGGLFTQRPDDFIADQFFLTPGSARQVAIAFIRHRKSLTRSRLTWRQYFDQLRRLLPETFNHAISAEFRNLIAEVLWSGEWRF